MTDPWPTYHDLMLAYRDCRLHKPASHSQVEFEIRLAQNIGALFDEIQSGRYRPRPATCFVVTRPKPREIFAADFRDRVVHHLLVTQLEPVWERKFIFSSFACRQGKGPHGAVRYLQRRVREISQGGLKPVWILQLDIEKFFVTIDRTIVCDLLLKHCHNEKQRELISVIYSHDARKGSKKSGDPASFGLIAKGKSWFDQPPERGIPIGNLTSQFGANVYLSGLDHFVQRELKPDAYLRYMDDLLLIDRDPDKIRDQADAIDGWLVNNRGQHLNPAKTNFTTLLRGITYLGYMLRQTDSQKEPLQVFPEPIKKWQLVSALRKLESLGLPVPRRPHPLAPLINAKDAIQNLASINSRLGILVHSRSFLVRKQALEHFIARTTLNHELPRDFADHWCPYRIKKGYRAITQR